MLDQVRVAAVPFEARPGERDANLARLDRAAARAAAAGAHLLLAPELAVTGFIPNHPVGDHAAWLKTALAAARRMAEPLDGPAVRGVTDIARRHDLLIAAGLLEDAGAHLHNTHVLVGRDGVIGAWRKMHVPMFEQPFYNGGGVPSVVDTPVGRIGVTICFDAFLPESTRLLAVQGAEIVLFPFAADPPPVTPAGWRAWAGPVTQLRCAENAVFGVACNVRGALSFAGASQTFGGGTLIVGPSGQVIAEDPGLGDDLAVADLRRDAQLEARSAFEYTFRFRRPELYARLCEP